MEVITYITYWYSSPCGTFIRIFGREILLHVLPRYITNKLVMQEVSYHLATWLLVALQRKTKEPWPTLPLHIGLYEIKNLKVMDAEGKEIVRF